MGNLCQWTRLLVPAVKEKLILLPSGLSKNGSVLIFIGRHINVTDEAS